MVRIGGDDRPVILPEVRTLSISSQSTDSSDATALFSHEELIYSRTDPRGILLSANAVFQRMVGMPWERLIGAPHRVVRHPDMPRGFFHLFWSRLQAGDPVVGYVKNRCADGRHYWVLAAAMPYDGGYFSVRMRPSAPSFDMMRAEYTALRAREESERLSPEASCEALLARLADHGFPTYDAFATHALSQEMRARDAHLRRPVDAEAEVLDNLISLLTETLAEQGRLVAMFQDLVLLPVNMRLVAARLEPQGGPISQISVNYKMASEEISRRLSDFVSGKGNICGQMAHAVRKSLVLAGCARLQGELTDQYDRIDAGYPGIERRKEGGILAAVREANIALSKQSLKEATRLAAVLNAASVDLRRMILGLDTIRILARVESRKSGDSQAALTATIDRIDEVQAAISSSLKTLMERTSSIDAELTALLQGTRAVTMAAE